MIKIYYPTMSFLPLNERKNTWYPYLLKGFQQIGQVILSEEMSEISAYKKGEAITVFDVEIEGKKRRVFYDWTDFMVDNRERAKSHNALYFKI